MVSEKSDGLDEMEFDEDGDEEGVQKKKLPGRTLVLFIILPLIGVVTVGYGALSFFTGKESKEETTVAHHVETPKLQDPTQVVFKSLEEILVNIRTPDNSSAFLSLTVSLEFNKDQDEKMLEAALPRIRDKFQVYLRELRLEDLTGAAGTQRVKEELLRRVNIAASPVKVNAVLIEEMVVQ